MLHLRVSADEAGEASQGGRLQACSRGSRSGQFEDLRRGSKSLHGDGTKRFNLDIPLGEPHRRRAESHRTWRR